MTYAHTAQAIADVATSADVLFDYLDDQASLGSHMQKPSMMMLGGRMSYEFDEARGRTVGSVIRMRGNILGLVLSVEEVITERQPPRRKVWETRGPLNFLVIGAYRMGFEISAPGPGLAAARIHRLRLSGYDRGKVSRLNVWSDQRTLVRESNGQ